MKQEEREMDRLIAAHNPNPPVTQNELKIERQGLSLEEELSQSFVSLDDL